MDEFKKLSLDRFDPLMDCPYHGMNGNPKKLKRIRRQEGRARLKKLDHKLMAEEEK